MIVKDLAQRAVRSLSADLTHLKHADMAPKTLTKGGAFENLDFSCPTFTYAALRGFVPTTESSDLLASPDPTEVSLRDVFDIFFRRRRLILVVMLLCIVAGCLLMLRPRRYTADGVIRVQPGTSSIYRSSPAALFWGEESDKIASETAVAQSRTLYLNVAKELNLVNDPTFWGESHRGSKSLDDPKTREEVVRQMKKEISIGRNPKDELIAISCTTIDPALSSKIVNTLINDYISDLFRIRYGSTKRVSDWVIGQLDDLKQQLQNDQTEIVNLQKKLGVIGFSEQTSEYLQTQSLDSITKAATQATVERIIAEAKLRNLQGSDPNLMEGEVNLLNQGTAVTAQNSLLQNLRNTQAQAASNYARLVAQFGPNYPDVRQQKAQLDEINNEVRTEQKRILNQAEVSYEAAKANENMDSDLLHKKTGEAFSQGGDMVHYVLLLRDYQSHRSLYEGLVQRLREAGITSGLEAGEVDIVDLADIPAIPNPPGPLLLLVGAIIVGCLGGCLVALLFEVLETRITTSEQAQRATKLPLLAHLPHLDMGDAKPQSQIVQPQLSPISGVYAESLQSLRSSILMAKPGLPPKVVLVTSAVPREGKSTTARNLAATFARHKISVLLIDCDLRKGAQASALGLSSNKGVTNILTGQTSLDLSVQQIPGHENLMVLANGTRTPDPAVLINSTQMNELIHEAADKYDLVILDTAPILGISDTVSLGKLADVIVYIARERFSHRAAISHALTQMRNAKLPVIGFALNDVDLRAHSYAYGYGYGEAYANYYQDSPEAGK